MAEYSPSEMGVHYKQDPVFLTCNNRVVVDMTYNLTVISRYPLKTNPVSTDLFLQPDRQNINHKNPLIPFICIENMTYYLELKCCFCETAHKTYDGTDLNKIGDIVTRECNSCRAYTNQEITNMYPD